jgi:hypothetical protein
MKYKAYEQIYYVWNMYIVKVIGYFLAHRHVCAYIKGGKIKV